MTSITWTEMTDRELESDPPEPYIGVLMSAPESDSRWTRAEERLLVLRRLEADWDGLGADAPNPELVDSAVQFLAAFRRENPGRPPDSVVAGPNGQIVFEWQLDGLLFEAEMEEPGIVEWLRKEPGGPATTWSSIFWVTDQDVRWEMKKNLETAAVV